MSLKEVTSTVKCYAVTGPDCTGEGMGDVLFVSADSWMRRVVLEFKGERFAVMAGDLHAAIQNAENTN